MTLRVLLCDGQSLTRLGMRAALVAYPDVDLIDEADNAARALRAVAQHDPDVVLADIGLPGLPPVELTRRIAGRPARGDGSGTPTAVLTLLRTVDETAVQALRAGAAGIILKTCEIDDLVRAIRIVSQGDGFVDPPLTRYVIEHLGAAGADAQQAEALDALTPREQEVLGLVANGMSNHEIATALYVGESTVKYHMSQMLRKLRLRDRVQAAAFAHQTGLAAEL
jgi:DNA-binding NarL/FixJ family response regulator